MLNRIRDQIGTAGLVVAIVALIAALGGGAYAASGPLASSSGHKRHHKAKHKKAAAGLNAKQKREVKKIAKVFQGSGPAGAAGADGAQGPAGPAGDTGAQGLEGATGAAGSQGPQGLPGAQGPEGPEGPEGSPWTDGGTLPAGETETGTWAIGGPEGTTGFAAISFPIPLAAPLEAANRHLFVSGAEGETAECPGTFGEPEAAPGNLCVYTQSKFNATLSLGGANPAVGAYVSASLTGSPAFGQGTWAVTAPTP